VPSCRRAVVPSCRRAVVPSCRRAAVRLAGLAVLTASRWVTRCGRRCVASAVQTRRGSGEVDRRSGVGVHGPPRPVQVVDQEPTVVANPILAGRLPVPAHRVCTGDRESHRRPCWDALHPSTSPDHPPTCPRAADREARLFTPRSDPTGAQPSAPRPRNGLRRAEVFLGSICDVARRMQVVGTYRRGRTV
jgi:hypothetical protein